MNGIRSQMLTANAFFLPFFTAGVYNDEQAGWK